MAIIDTATNTVTGRINTGPADDLVLTPDGTKLHVSIGRGGDLVVDVATGQTIAALPRSGGVFSPDGSRLYTTYRSNVSIIDAAANQVVGEVPAISPSAVAITPDGRRVYVTNTLDLPGGLCNAPDFEGLQILDTQSGRMRKSLKLGGRSCVVSVVISPDGRRAYVAEEAYVNSLPIVHVIDVATEEQIGNFDLSPGESYGLAISADGKTLFAVGNSRFQIVDLASGRMDGFTIADDSVRIALRPMPPALAEVSLVNGATFEAKVARGSLASVVGTGLARGWQSAAGTPLPTSLLDTRVFINGTPAPIVFTSDGQVNVQVPWEAGAGPASLRVTRGPLSSEIRTITIDDVAPGIFVMDANGTGAITRADTFQLITPQNPARAGDLLTLFMTGLGGVKGAVTSGQAPPSPAETMEAPRVTIGGAVAEVVFSGLSTQYPGLYQVNVRVPPGVSAGAAVAVAVTIAGRTSNIVTTAVR